MILLKNLHTIYFVILTIPFLLSSTYLFPTYIRTTHLPLFIISLGFLTPYIKRCDRKTYTLILLLFIVSAIFFIFNSLLQSEDLILINFRWELNFFSFLLCLVAGRTVAKVTSPDIVFFSRAMMKVFIFFNIYGIYTYFCQRYNLPEFFYFLRPNPDFTASEVYMKIFYGVGSPWRAYSVWFEPSFVSLYLACCLPFIFSPSSSFLKILFLVSSMVFTHLTYSRAAFIVLMSFPVIYFITASRIYVLNKKLRLLLTYSFIIFLWFIVFFIVPADDESSFLRINSIRQAFDELLASPIIGTGSNFNLTAVLNTPDGKCIHSSIAQLAHFYGIGGIIIICTLYWFLTPSFSYVKNKQINCFIFLSIIAISIGGAIMMFPSFWFFAGYYYFNITKTLSNYKNIYENINNHGSY